MKGEGREGLGFRVAGESNLFVGYDVTVSDRVCVLVPVRVHLFALFLHSFVCTCSSVFYRAFCCLAIQILC